MTAYSYDPRKPDCSDCNRPPFEQWAHLLWHGLPFCNVCQDKRWADQQRGEEEQAAIELAEVNCECGKITEVRCERLLDSRAATLEWVPPSRRDTATTLGAWRGLSERLAVDPECAAFLADDDEWIEEVERKQEDQS